MSFLGDLDRSTMPRHVAIVMDGNGRWAKERGLPRTEGHNRGEEALFDVIQGGLEAGLQYLTVFAFSTENWKRPPSEVRYLMNFKRETLRRRTDQMHSWDVKVQFVGRRDWRLPRGVLNEMERAEEKTKRNRTMTLTIALNYGGRTEIVDAVRRILEEHDRGRLGGERITPDSISSRLYDPRVPDPDLLIRTGGEMRISNFLLWQAAYAELWFTPIFWPDFNREHLYEAIRDYQKRDRRFGRVPDA
jgi:undecaprenyl diphosphate synthase